MSYLPTKDIASTLRLLKEKIASAPDYIDAIQLSPNSGIVMVGNMSDDESLSHPHFRRAWQGWFYLHVNKVRLEGSVTTEAIPIRDYLFRYDRGAFWVGEYGFGILHMPNNWLTRLIFNQLFTTRTLYRFLHATNASGQYLIQDICLPETEVEKLAVFNDQTVPIYPLWLCPARPGGNDLSPTSLGTEMVINIGIWGKYLVNIEKFIAHNREIEEVVAKLGGKKVLYAHSYYPLDEFWKIYDKSHYYEMRKKYFADRSFASIYDIVTVKERVRSSRLTGLLGLIFSPYRIKKS